MPYRVVEELRTYLLGRPESGMGFQFVRDDDGHRHLILNAEIALTFVHQDAFEVEIAWLQENGGIAADGAEDDWLALLGRLEAFSMSNCRVEGHGSYPSNTTEGEVLVRYSAFSNDRRIGQDGSVRAGTYCTTKTDTAVVPSALAAVGRYALPNPNPAVHRFDLKPAGGSRVYCGTSAPNFGQAGGGVEVRIDQTLPPGTVVEQTRIAER